MKSRLTSITFPPSPYQHDVQGIDPSCGLRAGLRVRLESDHVIVSKTPAKRVIPRKTKTIERCRFVGSKALSKFGLNDLPETRLLSLPPMRLPIAPVVYWLTSSTSEVVVRGSNLGMENYIFWRHQLPTALYSAGKHNSTRVGEGTKW